MIEAPRHRSFELVHTIRDSIDGPLSDLTDFVEVRSQIREKTALRNEKTGIFENALVTDVVAVLSGTTNSTLTLSLSREIVTMIPPGDYLVDAIGLKENGDYEVFLNPEPIRFTNRPTYQTEEDNDIPNFVEIFQNALSGN